MIPFNKPFLCGSELDFIKDSIDRGKLSGNGYYTKKCQKFFEDRYSIKKCLLTTSCTDALEMASILLEIGKNDEVIVPSYTFVSTALAFTRQGAKVVFADSLSTHPNIDPNSIEKLITKRTKAIVVVHYAGVAVNLKEIMLLCKKYKLFLVEDAAQAVESKYNNSYLGSFGHLSTFSFHETKNIISGEGGMLCINDERFIKRSEIIWEKGTDRAAFFRGEINKYGWVDTGSSFLPSESIAAFLYAQLENIDLIQAKRLQLWNKYNSLLSGLNQLGKIKTAYIPNFSTNNAHMFYIILNDSKIRTNLILYLKQSGIHSVFHYQSLCKSPYYLKNNDEKSSNIYSDVYSNQLLRLPLFYELSISDVEYICEKIIDFFEIS